jgi:hypothetical protein
MNKNIYYNKYIKYKLKYLLLNNEIQIGSSIGEINKKLEYYNNCDKK